MAWRIDEAVIRGEIDNRTRGRVTGRIWFVGRDEPVVLDLQGNCHRDLAGRRLEFTNPHPKAGQRTDLAPLQCGTTGDITASLKLRVPDIPVAEIVGYLAAGKPFPWHWGNVLSLEWFGDRDGRIVVETAEFGLKIIGAPTWIMTPAEEERQRIANAAAMSRFMAELEAPAPARPAPEAEDPEADSRPLSEEEAERMQARSDLLADRIQSRLAREGAAADYGQILEEEMARLRRELGEPEPTPEQLARNAEWIEELNRAAEETLADPESLAEEHSEHPLAERAFEFSLGLDQEVEEQAWVPEGASEEHPVAELTGAVMKAAAKLAGALNGVSWPPPLDSCASIIVRLKRARVYLDDALRAMESCQEEKLIPLQRLGVFLVEVIDLAHDADEIIEELRERLEPDDE